MKKYAVVTAFLLVIGLSTGVVNGTNNSSDGDMQATKTGSTAGTAAVGPNGTQYDTYFSVTSQNLSADTTGITDSDFDGDTFRFNGSFQTNTPCYELIHEVTEEEDNRYVFEITSKKNDSECVTALAYHSYEASFEADEPYHLTVKHENETIERFAHPDYEKDTIEERDSQGIFSSFMGFMRNLF